MAETSHIEFDEPIDLTVIDERIRKLQMLRELASDPAMRPLLREILAASDGTTSAYAAPDRSPQATEAKASIASLQGVRREVHKYVPEVGAIGVNNPTARDILEQMKHSGYRFRSKNHLLTVKEQLRELERSGLIEKAGTKEDGSALWRRT